MSRTIAFVLLPLLLGSPALAQRALQLRVRPGYYAEPQYIFEGRHNTGAVYLGLADLQVDLGYSRDSTSRWGVFFYGVHTHGGAPSIDYTGDIQVYSNIEGENFTGVSELYIYWQGSRARVIIGQQDINSQFNVSRYGFLYTHSSFGIIPNFTVNFLTPTYPYGGLSLMGEYTLGRLSLRAGVFDGDVGTLQENKHGLQWVLNASEGYLMVTEGGGQLNDRIRLQLGAYANSGGDNPFTNADKSPYWGYYMVLDAVLWSQSDRKIAVFQQYGHSPGAESLVRLYGGVGVNFINMLELPWTNTLGLALAYASVDAEVTTQWQFLHSETVIEATWKVEVSRQLYLQPFLHYMIHQGGTADPLVAALRARITFSNK